MKKGEIWYADLEPTFGYEQAGERPVIIFQNDLINRIAPTVIAIPLTTNFKQGNKKTCVKLSIEETGLISESVALCHQIRILDKRRLDRQVGKLSKQALFKVEKCVFFTLGFSTLLSIMSILGLWYWLA